MTANADYEATDDEPPMPCCDYRDHGPGGCACPNHPRSALHVFGYDVSPNDGSGAI